MAQKKDNGDVREGRKKFRHKSDDITSLDSWSELTGEPGDKNCDRKTELLLSPSALSTIDEPPQTKRISVKLHKSANTNFSGDGFRSRPRNMFFRHMATNLNETESDTFQSDCEAVPEGAEVNRCAHSAIHSHSSVCKDCDKINKESGRHSGADVNKMNVCSCGHCADNKARLDHRNEKIKHHNSYLKTKHRLFNSHHAKRNISNGSIVENDEDQIDQSEKVKNKILSVWNNVKYGWTLKTKASFQDDSPIFLLGKCYHKKPGDSAPEPGQMLPTAPSPCMAQFHQDFQSRLWFTYRRDFQALAHTKFTTDCGWGCMLRSSQMMMAHAFICHFLGRDWRAHNQSKEQETFYRTIIQWFGDTSSDQCPFSVHKLADFGRLFGKQPGEWYGPSSVAYILRDAVNKASQSQTVLKDICVYVAQDCTVYKEDIHRLCTTRPRNLTDSSDVGGENVAADGTQSASDSEWTKSVVVLIPVRLGGEDFNPIYEQCIKNLISQESCIGLIGGKPKHSLYFVGWQDNKLIYLDPHFCQDSVDTLRRDFKVESYHCFSPRKISLVKIDPSATVGFYCRTKKDFQQFVEQSEMIVTPSRGSFVYPMFVFNEGSCEDMMRNSMNLSIERSLRIQHSDDQGRYRSSTADSEDYVVL